MIFQDCFTSVLDYFYLKNVQEKTWQAVAVKQFELVLKKMVTKKATFIHFHVEFLRIISLHIFDFMHWQTFCLKKFLDIIWYELFSLPFAFAMRSLWYLIEIFIFSSVQMIWHWIRAYENIFHPFVVDGHRCMQ